jgi:hypothetical protein
LFILIKMKKLMTKPRSIKESALELIPRKEKLYLVVVHSSNGDLGAQKRFLHFNLGFEIPEKRVLKYTPPRHKDGKTIGYSGYEREEKIPKIKDLKGTYIIMDDSFEKGNTLECALDMLLKQDLPITKIWFFAGALIDKEYSPQDSGLLDFADVFIKYREENPYC